MGIADLTATTDINSPDQIAVYSASLGDTYRVAISTFVKKVQDDLDIAGATRGLKYEVPLTGATITLDASSGNDIWLLIRPDASLAALTIDLTGTPARGQEIVVTCNRAVTTLTITSTAAVGGNQLSSFIADGFFRIKYDDLFNVWRRAG